MHHVGRSGFFASSVLSSIPTASYWGSAILVINDFTPKTTISTTSTSSINICAVVDPTHPQMVPFIVGHPKYRMSLGASSRPKHSTKIWQHIKKVKGQMIIVPNRIRNWWKKPEKRMEDQILESPWKLQPASTSTSTWSSSVLGSHRFLRAPYGSVIHGAPFKVLPHPEGGKNKLQNYKTKGHQQMSQSRYKLRNLWEKKWKSSSFYVTCYFHGPVLNLQEKQSKNEYACKIMGCPKH